MTSRYQSLPSLSCTVNDVNVTSGLATVLDGFGKQRTVRMDIRKGGGPYPRVGDVWMICQDRGVWTFDTLIRGNPPVVLGNTAGIDALDNTLEALDAMGFIDDQTFSSGGGEEGEAAPGLIPGEPIYFTTPGAHTFTKAEYPGAAAFVIECQGAGGGGGGCVVTIAAQISAGAGGGGGGYARSIVQATDLDATEAITVGAGGTGVTGATGNTGADSSFDTIPGEVRGSAGIGGASGSSFTPPVAVLGGGGGITNTGDFTRGGDDGERGLYLAASSLVRAGGSGGASFLGSSKATLTSGSAAGSVGRGYGGGGSGAHNAPSDGTARAGGAGAAGIVIVTPLYPPAGGIVGVGAPGVGLIWGGTLYFDDDDVFAKSDFLGIRGVLVEAQGGGGGGGGGATAAASQVSLGGGGAGGGYARRWVPVESLAPSEAIAVGAGGVAGAASSAAAGNGGNSSFGAHCVGNGGVGGTGSASQAVPTTAPTNPPAGASGTGDLVIPGTAGQQGFATGGGTAQGFGSSGGHSHLGAGGRGLRTGGASPGPGQTGVDGNLYGGGGAGAVVINTQTGALGGDGARGRVMVHLYYASGGEGGSPPGAGYIEGAPIYFKTPGAATFTKADYPGLKAVKVECQAGGGGSGGTIATAAGQVAIGGPGGGGAYVRSIIPVSDLAPTEAITVGAGGAAGVAGNNPGGNGADSVFDTISDEVRAAGGGNGAGSGAVQSAFPTSAGGPGGGGSTGTGDFLVEGSDGLPGFILSLSRSWAGSGGQSFLGAVATRSFSGGTSAAAAGRPYGAGAFGGVNIGADAARVGAPGGDGLVIVTPLY